MLCSTVFRPWLIAAYNNHEECMKYLEALTRAEFRWMRRGALVKLRRLRACGRARVRMRCMATGTRESDSDVAGED